MGYGSMSVDEQELARIHLFRYVSPELVKSLLDRIVVRELEPEEILLEPGQINSNIFFILSGKVRIHLDSPNTAPMAILGPGESVGEMSVIDQQQASAFAIAQEPCRLLMMNESTLWSLVQSSHAAACNLLFILTKRLRLADSVIVDGIHLEKEYRHYGTVDALTGLHNRHWMDSVMKRQLLRSATSGRTLSVMMIDIDHFKELNDKFGHLCGDRALSALAHVFGEHLRPNELVARYGGDEFILILPDISREMAWDLAQRLQREIRKAPPVVAGENSIPLPSISVGIAEMTREETVEALIGRADEALYRAKEKGRDCISD